MSRMAQIRFDHVGVTVAELDPAIDFFVRLGLDVEGRMHVEGDFLDTVCGLSGARTEIAMLRPPGGGTAIELSAFERPAHEPAPPDALAHRIGLQNVCFEVEDLHALVEAFAEDGYGLVGGIGRHQDSWLMAYVRGPSGVVVSLAQRLG
jgi:catechol 2,3-dioxygenase-like lactoylglutathione lyase family enzyme